MKKSSIYRTTGNYLCTVLIANLFFISIVTAQDENNLARNALVDSVEQYVYAALKAEDTDNLHVEAMKLDKRITVPHCPSPIQVSASPEALAQTNITVRASCEDTNWYLYLMVKATRVQDVVVLKRAVSPGTLLTHGNVETVKMDKNLIRTSTFANIESVIGARMKKRSRSGQPIVPGQLCFVCKGDNILITANAGGLLIKTSGIAQQDGNLGDTIAVKNISSKKTVHAQVIDTKQVEVQI